MSDREPDTLGAMADDLGLSLPAVSRAVEGLHKRGLVKRVEAARRPARQARVADREGPAHLESLVALRVAGLRGFVDGLEPHERDALAEGIAPLLERPEISASPRAR